MQVFSVPEEVHIPDFDESMIDGRYSMEKDNEVTDKFITDLKAWCLANGWTGKLTGEIVSWGVADGAAQYMVIHQPGFTPSMAMIHLPIHDAWSIDPAMARGLRQKDIRDRVESNKRMDALFGRSSGSQI